MSVEGGEETKSANITELEQLLQNSLDAPLEYHKAIVQLVERLEIEIRHLKEENQFLKGDRRHYDD